MWYFIILNFIAALLIAGFTFLKRKTLQHVLSAFLICLWFPVGGIVIVWIIYQPRIGINTANGKLFRIGKKILLGSKLDEVETNEDFLPNAKAEIDSRFSSSMLTEEDADVVPLEETLLISDYHQRRKTIMNILKRDVSNYIELINLALNDKDSETSHYAASGYINIKRKIDNRLRKIQIEYKNNLNNYEITRQYAEVLNLYLYKTRLGKDSRNTYLAEYSRVLQELIDYHKDQDTKYINYLLVCLLDQGDIENAVFYCQILEMNYPETEEKYLVMLSCYFGLGDKMNFDRLLKRFTKSDIRFSRDTLEIIRFWLGDEK